MVGIPLLKEKRPEMAAAYGYWLGLMVGIPLLKEKRLEMAAAYGWGLWLVFHCLKKKGLK